MNFYRTPVAVFGIVLPALLAAIVTIVAVTMKSRIAESFTKKQDAFRSYQASHMMWMKAEKDAKPNRGHYSRWMEALAQEAPSQVNASLRTISTKLPPKEFQRTAFERPQEKTTLGARTGQNSSQLKIVFRGTYRTMQQAFLELETRMPRLQLHELTIEPNLNPGANTALMSFQATYTAWEQ
jgi:hypothetical protein